MSLAWEEAPMGEPLSQEEQDLADEGLRAIESGEVVRREDVVAEIDARQRMAG